MCRQYRALVVPIDPHSFRRLRGTVRSSVIFHCPVLRLNIVRRCIMSLIRGLQAYCPCPKCLVKWDQLLNLSLRHELRTAAAMQAVLSDASNPELTAAEKEAILKDSSIRNVPVSPVSYSLPDWFHSFLGEECVLPDDVL